MKADSQKRFPETGMKFELSFATPGVHPYEEIQWERRRAEIKDHKGNIIFEQDNVEVPGFWSQTATNIVAQKYFWGQQGTEEREYSVQQLVDRVADLITAWGEKDGYFDSQKSSDNFNWDLKWLMVNQYATFNSPTHFNAGVNPCHKNYWWDSEAKKARLCSENERDMYQFSACYLLPSEDTIEAIAHRGTVEMKIFKDGSGCGTNNSKIRSFREPISGGGQASGPVSFMRIYDAIALTTKSAGKSRRAAKLERLDMQHPDILEFILSKTKEEAKAHALIREGYEANFNGEAYSTVCFQNSNISVGASDAFMKAVENDEDWQTLSVATGTPYATDGTLMPKYKARFLMDEIALSNWKCGDPGFQFDDTINDWHTVPNHSRIETSNPCFSGCTRVLTKKGWMRIDEIVEKATRGDIVPLVRKDGSLSTPSQWMNTGENPILKVKISGNRTLRVTPDHQWALTDGTRKKTEELSVGDQVLIIDEGIAFFTEESVENNFDSYLGIGEIISVSPDGHESTYNVTEPEDGFIWANGVYIPQCSEYFHVDSSACNLASINLLKFRNPHNSFVPFDSGKFKDCVDRMITAQEISVTAAGYPTPEIAENSYRLRPLGLGYSNLGSLLLSLGLPYDSEEGRSLAGAITSFLTARAYRTSAKHASNLGSFDHFENNREPMIRVIRKHQDASQKAARESSAQLDMNQTWICDLWGQATRQWDFALSYGERWGYRNSQVSLVAPAGTISFKMDCATTGLEPDLAIVKYKSLAGRGNIKIVNDTVPIALRTLGYTQEQIDSIVEHIKKYDTIEDVTQEGAVIKSGLHSHHLPVFDCSFPPANGIEKRSLRWQAHVLMVASIQPWLSGSASKTTNLPEEATVDDIKEAYFLAWKKGLKCLAVYRDGSKKSQPLSTKKESSDEIESRHPERTNGVPALPGNSVSDALLGNGTANSPQEDSNKGLSPLCGCNWLKHEVCEQCRELQNYEPTAYTPYCGCGENEECNDCPSPMPQDMRWALERLEGKTRPEPQRVRLPETRNSITHKFELSGCEGYITVGLYEDGSPGELFLQVSKEGSTISGLLDTIGTLVSLGLQYGIPLEVYTNKFIGARFEPSGFTRSREIPMAKSIVDYVFRWLEKRFLSAPDSDGELQKSPSHDKIYTEEYAAVLVESINGESEAFSREEVPFRDNSPKEEFSGNICPQCGMLLRKAGSCDYCSNCQYSSGCG